MRYYRIMTLSHHRSEFHSVTWTLQILAQYVLLLGLLLLILPLQKRKRYRFIILTFTSLYWHGILSNLSWLLKIRSHYLIWSAMLSFDIGTSCCHIIILGCRRHPQKFFLLSMIFFWTFPTFKWLQTVLELNLRNIIDVHFTFKWCWR